MTMREEWEAGEQRAALRLRSPGGAVGSAPLDPAQAAPGPALIQSSLPEEKQHTNLWLAGSHRDTGDHRAVFELCRAGPCPAPSAQPLGTSPAWHRVCSTWRCFLVPFPPDRLLLVACAVP